MIKLALLGKDIQHSRSKEMYTRIYSQEIDYTLLDCALASDVPTLEDIFSNVMGLSITAPYKKHYLSQLKIADEVLPLNAVNCIRKVNDVYEGTNTDYLAVEEILEELNFKDKTIVLLGSGSMAHVTELLLTKHKKEYIQYSRAKDGDISTLDLTEHDGEVLVINSCARAYAFKGRLKPSTIFWDFNYSHQSNTQYLSNKCKYIDGEEMLFRQAVHATKFWNFVKDN